MTSLPSRREMMLSLTYAAGALAMAGLPWPALGTVTPRSRVIVDNDFSGDPDGLFQLAHHLLSPSVSIPLIIGTHLHPGESWTGSDRQAETAAAIARELVHLLGRGPGPRIVVGRETARAGPSDHSYSAATDLIIHEAMRADDTMPLYYAAGAGLTEIALAWLKEPRIGRRLKLVWIGGGEHADLAIAPPGASGAEYNLTIDLLAAQVVFNQSDIEIWQVPRDAYRQMLFSSAELEAMAARSGKLGAYLKAQIDRVAGRSAREGKSLGETYILGDNPLVTLTALQSSFEPDPSSSRFHLRPTPAIEDNGGYAPNAKGRPMRVYTAIDSRLTFSDMVAKFAANAARER